MQRFCPVCKLVKEITELQNEQYVLDQAKSGNPLSKVSFRCEAGHFLEYSLKK